MLIHHSAPGHSPNGRRGSHARVARDLDKRRGSRTGRGALGLESSSSARSAVSKNPSITKTISKNSNGSKRGYGLGLLQAVQPVQPEEPERISWVTGTATLPRLELGTESPLVKTSINSSGTRTSNRVSRSSAVPEQLMDRKSSQVVTNNFWQYAVNLVIIVGAVQMGLEVDFHDATWHQVWWIWHNFYAAVSTLEMFLMIDSHRRAYFTNPWMLLEFALAIVSIVDAWVLPLAGANDVNASRVLRLLRVLRIIRMTQVVPALAVVVEGLLNSIRSMFWIFALLFVILYAGSICCVSVLGHSDAGYPGYTDNMEEVRNEQVDDFNSFVYFGTLFRSMLTLLGMMLLSEWPLVRPVAEVHALMIPLFLFLLVLVTFGVLNVIIGVVVEKTTKAMDEPRLQEIEAEQVMKASLAESLADIVYTIDTDQDGRVSVDELEEALTNENFANMLIDLDLPHGFTVVEFLSMLDVDGRSELRSEIKASVANLQLEMRTALQSIVSQAGVDRNSIRSSVKSSIHVHGLDTVSNGKLSWHSEPALKAGDMESPDNSTNWKSVPLNLDSAARKPVPPALQCSDLQPHEFNPHSPGSVVVSAQGDRGDTPRDMHLELRFADLEVPLREKVAVAPDRLLDALPRACCDLDLASSAACGIANEIGAAKRTDHNDPHANSFRHNHFNCDVGVLGGRVETQLDV